MVGGSPLIVLEGTQGKVVLAEPKAAESVINAFKSLNANILVQDIKANGKTFVVCYRRKSSCRYSKETMPGEFRANIHLGGTSIIKVTEEKKNSY
jgi:ribosomal protein S6--L-glutamate ligase